MATDVPEMVERIGEAVLDVLSNRRAFRNAIDLCEDIDLHDARAEVGRAVIETMRPDDAMIQAGFAACAKVHEQDVIDIWNAMRSAALGKEHTE